MRRVALVVLDYATIRVAKHGHARPSAIPDLHQCDSVPSGVQPVRLLDRPSALLIHRREQIGQRSALVCLDKANAEVAPGIAGVANQFCAVREKQLRNAFVEPAFSNHIARVAQVRLGVPVPGHLIARNRLNLVRVSEWVFLAADEHPSDADRDLSLESVAACRVGVTAALGLVQFVVQNISYVGGVVLGFRRYFPVAAVFDLHTEHAGNYRPHQRLDRRRYSDLLHALQDFSVQLVAVAVVCFAVGLHAPGRLF